MKKGIFVSFLGGLLCLASILNAQQLIDNESERFEKNRKIPRGGVLNLKSRTVEFKKKDFSFDKLKALDSSKRPVISKGIP